MHRARQGQALPAQSSTGCHLGPLALGVRVVGNTAGREGRGPLWGNVSAPGLEAHGIGVRAPARLSDLGETPFTLVSLSIKWE